MTRQTPIFGFTVPDGDSWAHEIGDELGATVDRLEQVLADRAAVPGLADLNAVNAALQLTPYTALGLTPSFTNLAGFQPLRYSRVHRSVHLVGTLRLEQNLAVNGTAALAGLPAGYRPTTAVMDDVLINAVTPARIDVNPTGDIILIATGGAATSQQYVNVNMLVPLQ